MMYKLCSKNVDGSVKVIRNWVDVDEGCEMVKNLTSFINCGLETEVLYYFIEPNK